MTDKPDLEKLLSAITDYCSKYSKEKYDDAKELAEAVKENLGNALEELSKNPDNPDAVELLQEAEGQFYDLCEMMFNGIYQKYNIPLEVDVEVQAAVNWHDLKPKVTHTLFYEDQLQKDAYVVKIFFDNYYSASSPEYVYWLARVPNSASTFRALLLEVSKSLKKDGYKKPGIALKNEIENVDLYIENEQVSLDEEVNDSLYEDYFKTKVKNYPGFYLVVDFKYEEANDD